MFLVFCSICYDNNKINIDQLVNKKYLQKTLDDLTSFQRSVSGRKVKWCRLPYLGTFSIGLAKILKQYNTVPPNYKLVQMRYMLASPKDPMPLQEKCRVYKLACPDCPAIYIGETGRSFNVRFNEHKVAFESKLKKRQSAFAEHLLEKRHGFDLKRCTPRHIENRFRRRRIQEVYAVFNNRA